MDEDEPTTDTSEPGADLAPEPAAPVTAADPFAGAYVPNAAVLISTWAGYRNYRCSACGFAHLDQALAEAHVKAHGQTFTQGARP